MRLSILDQSPVSFGATARQAMEASMQLAQSGEKMGYTRYWIAEHHDFSGLACSAPEVMLGYIGANTEKIRIGAGAILLPHYKPLKVAESFNMLATLFPGRIDLGIGRAPGGSAEVTMALSDNFLQNVFNMPATFKELLHFINDDFPSEHMYSKITAAPLPVISPQPWILGTSGKSAKLAAENGTAYAFGHFMSDKDGPEIMKNYIDHFKPNAQLRKPESIVAVSMICAETTEKAQQLALSGFLWKIQLAKGQGVDGVPSIEKAEQYPYSSEDLKSLEVMRSKTVIGNPKEVLSKLTKLQALYQNDEFMIVTITHSYSDRTRSYELLANEVFT
ncbi:LLM class flavin-dependent oxidoreductase [Paenisporosarcina indica]|uniref:LLM class flavin-dependent oxidoreductase n=1 Tax=Paenisporosarcina indica TaxID=650093 RepID=UPI0009500F17|nr:LLM class flavin-dependent oxidoreductase [Paenisporosarcina indica]